MEMTVGAGVACGLLPGTEPAFYSLLSHYEGGEYGSIHTRLPQAPPSHGKGFAGVTKLL